MRIAEQVGFFTGLGVVIAALGALAFGRVTAAPSITWFRAHGRANADADAEDEPTRPLVG
jgi:hypothetical protein